MIADLSSVVLGFASPYQVRTPSVVWNKGRATPGATTTRTIQAVIAPISGEDLQRLPEGSRLEELVQVVTTDTLAANDVIEYAGKDYELEESGAWASLGGFNRYLARRKD